MNRNNAIWSNVNKPVTKAVTKTIKTVNEIVIPRTPSDVAWMAGGGIASRVASRVVGGIVKKGSKYVTKAYRNMGNK